MRFAASCAVVVAVSLLPFGCGWKTATVRYRLSGQVLDAETKKPVEGAFIDVADDREKLDFTITTDTVTGKDGSFDTIYDYQYAKWIWLGFPVFWLPHAPDYLYLEAYKPGYRRRIVDLESRDFAPCGETCPPNRIAPLMMHADTLQRKK